MKSDAKIVTTLASALLLAATLGGCNRGQNAETTADTGTAASDSNAAAPAADSNGTGDMTADTASTIPSPSTSTAPATTMGNAADTTDATSNMTDANGTAIGTGTGANEPPLTDSTNPKDQDNTDQTANPPDQSAKP